jgi:hypothetical protein
MKIANRRQEKKSSGNSRQFIQGLAAILSRSRNVLRWIDGDFSGMHPEAGVATGNRQV